MSRRISREDISDPEERQRIEDARDTDPQAATWCDEFQAADEPSAETLAVIEGMFAALDRSVWSRLHWQEATQSLADASAAPRRAVLELPDGQWATLVVHSTGDALQFEFDALPDRWRPASLVRCPSEELGLCGWDRATRYESRAPSHCHWGLAALDPRHPNIQPGQRPRDGRSSRRPVRRSGC